MNFAEWEPVYEAVLTDFGYDRAGDERARDVLAELVEPSEASDDRSAAAPLPDLSGATVAVAGAGPSLENEADRAREADAVVAASTAADRLLAAGVGVDLQVTDLDGSVAATRDLLGRGVPVAVHAHGDNVPLLGEHVPTMVRSGEPGRDGDATEATPLVPTTQAAPAGPVRNFGGFTDGDRAAFLADHLDAKRFVFLGWDFDDPDVGPEKRHKLEWAERLLYWLERRRGEEFDVLDGRRAGIDASALPVE